MDGETEAATQRHVAGGGFRVFTLGLYGSMQWRIKQNRRWNMKWKLVHACQLLGCKGTASELCTITGLEQVSTI